MRIRARAASLCAAAMLAAVLVPAAAQAQEPTQHGVWWPGIAASPGDAVGTPELMVPEIISPGLCPALGERATFTFSYADQGVVLGADGHFEEHGSFTLVGTAEDALVAEFGSTFSGSSPNGTIEGERHTGEAEMPHSGVSCGGTSGADRLLGISLQHAPTEHRLTSVATGAVTIERGSAHVHLSSWAAPAYTGSYATWFQSDQDADSDGVSDLVDNCVAVPNPGQANADGDSLGDACDPDWGGGPFESNDGFAGGGGKLPGGVHVSIALHSDGGSLHGSGELADGATRVRLLGLTGLRSDGARVIAVGSARIGSGDAHAYRLEIVDATNTFALEIADRRWAGALTNGNLVVK